MTQNEHKIALRRARQTWRQTVQIIDRTLVTDRQALNTAYDAERAELERALRALDLSYDTRRRALEDTAARARAQAGAELDRARTAADADLARAVARRQDPAMRDGDLLADLIYKADGVTEIRTTQHISRARIAALAMKHKVPATIVEQQIEGLCWTYEGKDGKIYPEAPSTFGQTNKPLE